MNSMKRDNKEKHLCMGIRFQLVEWSCTYIKFGMLTKSSLNFDWKKGQPSAMLMNDIQKNETSCWISWHRFRHTLRANYSRVYCSDLKPPPLLAQRTAKNSSHNTVQRTSWRHKLWKMSRSNECHKETNRKTEKLRIFVVIWFGSQRSELSRSSNSRILKKMLHSRLILLSTS